jgi:hypothetical protein
MSGFGRVPMFGGAAQQRQVRLSGASRTDVDSVEELRSKRQQRESRQAERQREAATLALQAAWRGARVRAQLRRDARVRFDALVANGGASGAPVDVATRELLRFLDASQRGDLARFVRVLHA